MSTGAHLTVQQTQMKSKKLVSFRPISRRDGLFDPASPSRSLSPRSLSTARPNLRSPLMRIRRIILATIATVAMSQLLVACCCLPCDPTQFALDVQDVKNVKPEVPMQVQTAAAQAF